MIISSIFKTIETELPEFTEKVRILRNSFTNQVNLVVNGKFIGIPVSTSLSFDDINQKEKTKLKNQLIIFKSKYNVFTFKLVDIMSLEFEITVK